MAVGIVIKFSKAESDSTPDICYFLYPGRIFKFQNFTSKNIKKAQTTKMCSNPCSSKNTSQILTTQADVLTTLLTPAILGTYHATHFRACWHSFGGVIVYQLNS